MAMHLPMFSPVRRAHSCVPSPFIDIETSALAPRWAYCSRRFGHDAAVKRSLTVGRRDADRIEVEAAVDLVVALDAPLEGDVGGEEFADRRIGQIFVYGSHVGLVGRTDGGAARKTGVENREERVLRTVVTVGVLGFGNSRGVGADLGDKALGVACGSPGGGSGFDGSDFGLLGRRELRSARP